MIETTTKEIFDHILINLNWYNGFCEESVARIIRSRHNKGTLSRNTYDKVLKFHGYKKVISYLRESII